jgi:ABC-2 type transport system permease protein
VRLAPAPTWTILGARVGVSLAVALAQAALFVGVALTPPFSNCGYNPLLPEEESR